ncbi:MAG: glycosyl hydrolase family 28-related protein, partial [Planctomycetota bacterium]
MSLRPRIAAIAFLVPLLLAPCGALSVATHAAQPGYPAGQGTGVEKSIRRMSEVDAAGGAAVARYADRRLASMGILDVTKAPYSADPTGEEDATAAIQQALRDARDARLVTYLPAGRYRVSDTIQAVVGVVQWDTFGYEGPSDPWEYEASFEYPCVLMGSRGKGRTALVLADRASGFDDPENPKPVLFFWARSMQVPGLKQVDPDVPQSNINFNQKILSLDIELGRGNPGAIGIDHRGAEGSSVEDVAVYAEGAAAGFRHAPGSGGAMHGIRVYGGRIGLDLDGTQPSPLISDLVLKGQTEAAILASSRGPLTLVGAEIEGAGIVVRRSPVSWDAALNMVDCVLSITKGETAIESERSAVLSNVWIRGAQTALKVADHPPNAGSADGWTLVRRYAAGSEVKLPNRLGGGVWRDPVWVDGRKLQNPLADVEQSRTGPPDEVLARHRRPALPGFDTEGVVNVKDAPFGAKGDGETDDAAAIQQAIDAHPLVFVPKGKYLVSRPIKLGPQTQLFGISNLHSMLLPKYTLPVFYSALEAQATDARPPFHDPDD